MTYSFGLPSGFWESNHGSLEDQPEVLTAEPLSDFCNLFRTSLILLSGCIRLPPPLSLLLSMFSVSHISSPKHPPEFLPRLGTSVWSQQPRGAVLLVCRCTVDEDLGPLSIQQPCQGLERVGQRNPDVSGVGRKGAEEMVGSADAEPRTGSSE